MTRFTKKVSKIKFYQSTLISQYNLFNSLQIIIKTLLKIQNKLTLYNQNPWITFLLRTLHKIINNKQIFLNQVKIITRIINFNNNKANNNYNNNPLSNQVNKLKPKLTSLPRLYPSSINQLLTLLYKEISKISITHHQLFNK